ncbi:MAG: cyclopropane fatty acyl phospholipid synthase [Patescibacteria group bacterium]
MENYRYKKVIEDLLALADVQIGGSRPWDIQVLNEGLYKRALSQGSIGLGEAYMDGWWDSPNLDQFFYKVLSAGLEKEFKNWRLVWGYLKAVVLNLQNRSRSFRVVDKHYDIGNNLYSNMLGPTMVYTCGYWAGAKNLEEAQEAKMDLVCRKIGLRQGMKILDIGCGFGSFMKFAVKKYGATAVGISISKEQIKFGKELCQGLPIEFKFLDYRDIRGEFDRVVSIGMLEAVGYKNFRLFMKVVSDCLKDDGLFLLHTIGNNFSRKIGDPWLNKYIFPNGLLPSLALLTKATEGLFILEDLHNFGQDYDKTLLAWFNNFSSNWPVIKKDYDERFSRMWKYYLLSCAGIFRARQAQLWQMVFSKHGLLGGYQSVR